MLEEYDIRWPDDFALASEELVQVEPSWVVEHIGSTAIPGMAAKPVIDLAVKAGSLAEVRNRFDELTACGWLRLARGPRRHLVLVKQDGRRRTHIAHFFAHEHWEGCHQRLFRDWLLTHEEDAARYLVVKRHAAEHAVDGPDYTARKADVVQGIVDRARAASGLPLVDIGEQ